MTLATLVGALALHVAAASPSLALPPLRAELGEVRLEDEDAIIEDTVAVLRTLVERKLATSTSTPRALRDVHAKSSGCVAARFVVDADVPPELRAGVFATAATYDATIRFSSAELAPTQSDWESSVRGLGIQVRGVAGARFEDTTNGTLTRGEQDFILNDRPVFALRDLREYHDAMVVRRDPLAGGPFLLTHLHAAAPLLLETRRIDDVVNTTYWSMTPLAIGDRAVKLIARPCVVRRPRLAALERDAPPADYLRARLRTRLASSSACFDLLAQVRDPARAALLPIEDATVEWHEHDAPPVRVARILIGPQDFDTPDANARCESLELNPWHALKAHQPLGSLNRGRLAVYRALAAFRAHPP